MQIYNFTKNKFITAFALAHSLIANPFLHSVESVVPEKASTGQHAAMSPENTSVKWELTDIVWALGIASTCDIGPEDPATFKSTYWSPTPNFPKQKFEKLKSGDTVWVKSRFIPHFSKEILPEIEVPFVLVITEGDESFPSGFVSLMNVDNFIKNDKIIHIFAQNCDFKGTSTKVSYLPIGVDFHSVAYNKGGYWGETGSPRQQEAAMNEIIRSFKPTSQRKIRAFVDFQHNDSIRYGGGNRHLEYGEDRTSIFKQLLPAQIMDYSERMKRTDLWKTKGQYAFSISPHGNGLDCHRTWEDLYLGCIVVVKTSPLDPMYQGLPVVIVQDWTEVTKDNMEKWLKQYGDASTNPKYREKLTNTYWLNKIQAAAKPYKKL